MMVRNRFRKLFKLNIIFIIVLSGCQYNDFPSAQQCENSDLQIQAEGTNPPDCASKGSIQITATGGGAPYTYALNEGTFGSTSFFTNIDAGSHIAKVQDSRGCVAEVEVLLVNESSGLSITEVEIIDSGCKTNEGGLIVTATGETSISYSLDNVNFGNTSGVFLDLAKGVYSVYVKDGEGCITSANNLHVTTGVSYGADIKPILELNCIKTGCHNGDNGANRNWSVFSNVKAKAQKIKELTGNGTMPADNPSGLPQEERDLIACWVDDGALDN